MNKLTIKVSLVIIGLTSCFVSAALPTSEDFEVLNNKICNADVPTEVGVIIKKPVFSLLGKSTNFSLKQVTEFVTGSTACPTLGCISHWRLVPSDHVFAATIPLSGDSHSEILYGNIYGYISPLFKGPSFYEGKNYSANNTFTQRGISVVTVDSSYHFSTGLESEVCDSTFVYVQNRPTIGTTLKTYDGLDFPTGIHTFIASDGLMDTFSEYAQQGKSIEYVWTFINLDYSWSKTVTTTSPKITIDIPYKGEHRISVRAFDGNFYSLKNTIYPYVTGGAPPCLGVKCNREIR